jgi:hypothetical protein
MSMIQPPAFIATLEDAARAADAEETAFRREAAARIGTLERTRTFAFRRLNVLRVMAEAAGRAPDLDASIPAQLGLIRDRLGWQDSESETRRAVLDRLAGLAACVDADVRTATGQPASSNACDELAHFENWYAEQYGGSFWALFDSYVAETPVVDF